MSGPIYCVRNTSTEDEVKQLIRNELVKFNPKYSSLRMTSYMLEELKSIKASAMEIDKNFRECATLMKQQIIDDLIACGEDDDVLLVGDNFNNIASKDLASNSKVFAQKYSNLWMGGVLQEISNGNGPIPIRNYWVKFNGKGRALSFTSKKIAFFDAPSDKLDVGTRIIARYRDGISFVKWLSGVVAEPPTSKNKNRYLVFFDDGYAQYNPPSDVRQVYDQSKFVWEDIKNDTATFIRDYIQQYPNRSMVHLKPNHIIKTVRNGDWSNSIVLEVDASLVKMLFTESGWEEWIYRGSRRLEPLFNELSKAEASQRIGRMPRFSTDPKLHKKGAYVVYTMQHDDNGTDKGVELIDLDPVPTSENKRAVARKSCFQGSNSISSSSSSTAVAAESETLNHAKAEPHCMMRNIDKSLFPTQNTLLKKHKKSNKCSMKCIVASGDDPSAFRGMNPLLIPMLYGWERKVTKLKEGARKKVVIYTSHCGRMLKNIDELDQCLLQSNSQLTIDLFSFDTSLSTDHEFIAVKDFCNIEDFSLGRENVKIPCINSLDRQYPEYIEYSTLRIPGKGVNLNTDKNFLGGCDCPDNCRDRTRCKCIKLTVDATNCIPNGYNAKAGYNHRMLKQPIITGLYECNSNCSCDHRCHNKVIQNGLNRRLQIYKTPKKGWGLRCMDDIPAGGFICVYSGQILTEESANEDGQLYGDEYLADLDHIDVVEKEKEGYESDVRMDDDDDDEEQEEEEEDDKEDDEDKAHEWEDYHIRNCEKKSTARRKSRSSNAQTKPKKSTNKSKKTNAVSVDVGKQKDLKKSVARNKVDDAKKEEVKASSVFDSFTAELNKQMPEDEAKLKNPDTSAVRSAASIGEARVGPPDVWEDEMYDMEIDIDEDEVNETNEIEESMDSANKELHDEEFNAAGEMHNSLGETNLILDSLTEKKKSSAQFEMNCRDVENMDTEPYEIGSDGMPVETAQMLNSHEGPGTEIKSSSQEKPEAGLPTKDNSRKTMRQLFGEDTVYIIDAKSIGNLGRYFNHSCSPNIFVQNVFFDTHDLRFPWVAFFASKFIKAGTELTWNYNYEVGSVPGKKLACHCGSNNCNGRLL